MDEKGKLTTLLSGYFGCEERFFSKTGTKGLMIRMMEYPGRKKDTRHKEGIRCKV
jgi:hypothetical protein